MRSARLSFALLTLAFYSCLAEKQGFLRSQNQPDIEVEGEDQALESEPSPEVHPESARDLQTTFSTKSVGSRTLYFVLISVRGSAPHPFTLQQLISNHFRTDRPSFKTTIERCSMGRLRVRSNGGMALTVPGTLRDYPDFYMWVGAAEKIASSRLRKSVYSMAQHVVFCAPRDAPFWGAVALQNGNRINMHGKVCMSMSAMVHEFGHNLNLLHASEGGDEYGDATGFMGPSYWASSGPRKCFNGYHSYQLRWYRDRSLALTQFETPRKIPLAAFVDYRKTTANKHYVIVDVAGLRFIQYNRAKGINAGTAEKKNLATVTSNTPGRSTLNGALGPGQAMTVAHGGRTLYIAACRFINAPAGSTRIPDVMEITIGYDRNWCGLI